MNETDDNNYLNDIITEIFNNLITFSKNNDFINNILINLEDKIKIYLYIIYSMLLLSILVNIIILILLITKKN